MNLAGANGLNSLALASGSRTLALGLSSGISLDGLALSGELGASLESNNNLNRWRLTVANGTLSSENNYPVVSSFGTLQNVTLAPETSGSLSLKLNGSYMVMGDLGLLNGGTILANADFYFNGAAGGSLSTQKLQMVGSGSAVFDLVKADGGTMSIDHYGWNSSLRIGEGVKLRLRDGANLAPPGLSQGTLSNDGHIELVFEGNPAGVNVGVSFTNNGLLSGDGTLNLGDGGVLTNYGTIRPGDLNVVGAIGVEGSLLLKSDSILQMDVGPVYDTISKMKV
jgi:hypothetical protein